MYNNNLYNGDLTTYAIMLLAFIGLVVIAIFIFKSPFHYPYFTEPFDVSGKRNPQIEDLIDEFLIAGNFSVIQNHNNRIQQWKIECQDKIAKSHINKYRTKQYQRCLDDSNAFEFILTRQQTRYKQINYVRVPYKVTQTVGCYSYNFIYLEDRNKELKNINYECTISAYHSKNQRRLMTKELRMQIMKRDNYTCQECGKYMPDEVGLHIDHKTPVNKGGKSVSSNLQVLCSKCNGRKSNKI